MYFLPKTMQLMQDKFIGLGISAEREARLSVLIHTLQRNTADSLPPFLPLCVCVCGSYHCKGWQVQNLQGPLPGWSQRGVAA